MAEDLEYEYSCPICFEFPENEVYQCVNGHIICHQCSTHVLECPQCKVPYGGNKIRNRVLEGILNVRIVDCPNKTFGCTATMSLKDISSHLRSCAYGNRNTQVKICVHLGYPCEYITDSKNIPDAINHFEKEHGIMQASSGNIRLVDFISADLQTSSIFTPYIFKEDKSYFLVVAKINASLQTLSLTCIHLKQADSDPEKSYAVELKILSKPNFLEFKTLPVAFSEVEVAIKNPKVEILGSTLKKNYIMGKHLELTIRIQSMSYKTLPDLSNAENNVCLAINVIQQHLDKQNDQITWHGTSCEGCKMQPIIGTRHNCLQCLNFHLCENCRHKKVHSQHLFTAISTSAQHYAVLKARWKADLGKFMPLLHDLQGPLMCTSCKSNGVQRNASYFCVQCVMVRGYCDTCYSDNTAKKYCLTHYVCRTGT